MPVGWTLHPESLARTKMDRNFRSVALFPLDRIVAMTAERADLLNESIDGMPTGGAYDD
jgi:hypothetical protein